MVSDRRYKELKADFSASQTTPIMAVDADILQHAVIVYTPKSFQMFQTEALKIWKCVIQQIEEESTVIKYLVS